MAKTFGIGETAHLAIGAFFMLVFFVGLYSGIWFMAHGDMANATNTLGICSATGLIPGVIFLYSGIKLARGRMELERLARFLAGKERCTVAEVAAEFGWSRSDAEDRMVAALAENMLAGNFDRGSGQFFTPAGMRDFEFLARCSTCGAGLGSWVPRTGPARCPYCSSDPRPGPVPGPAPAPASYGAIPQPSQGTGAAPPPGQYPPAPPPGSGYISPYPYGAPLPPQPVQQRRRTVRFLFFSLKPGALEGVGLTLFILGALFLGAAIGISATFWQGMFFTLVCSSVFYLPLLLVGGAFIIRAYREKRYKNELLDIVDYIETYRRITVDLLARKMALPEENVRRIVHDILEFELVEGYLTPDGSEFIVSLRKEDVQTVRACPYCRNPSINLQILRGGSEKCPFCSGVIYFQEGG